MAITIEETEVYRRALRLFNPDLPDAEVSRIARIASGAARLAAMAAMETEVRAYRAESLQAVEPGGCAPAVYVSGR